MVHFDNVTKIYDGDSKAVDGLSLEIQEGELVVFIGPSGCGKTTTLKMVNRLESITSGTIYVNGQDINKINPVKLRRGIGYVIQSIGLLPHMSVADNIAMVPKLLGWPTKKIRSRVDELLEMAKLPPNKYRWRLPDQLSGGQKQRVGVLRALAADPPVVLMDEPFGALDPISRNVLQEELLELQKKVQKTIIFVTHDMDEALKMADKIVLMRQGRVEQIGSPAELQNSPATEFVRNFIGEERLAQISPEDPVEGLYRDPWLAVSPGENPADVMEKLEDLGADTAQMVDPKSEKWLGMIHMPLLKRAIRSGGDLKSVARKNRKLYVEDSTLRDAATMLADEDIPIPVVDEEEHFLGIITSGDVAKLAIGRLGRDTKGGA
ncbi:MAG TPA: betaine/proline/choline family ABC transporter ATP-binding protein [Synergistaceae bacterium]|nr:betaine/proline/choline family ABC transporter ATP-binding protein [Synergistaceae bacterium]HPQ38232.1 betaine/proline/choline family ABC transporter ATP-binding protein [Synergistaceae bacterium]